MSPNQGGHTQLLFQQIGHGLHHLIANRVATGIIHGFEMIPVDQRKTERQVSAAYTGELNTELLFCRRLTQQASDTVPQHH